MGKQVQCYCSQTYTEPKNGWRLSRSSLFPKADESYSFIYLQKSNSIIKTSSKAGGSMRFVYLIFPGFYQV